MEYSSEHQRARALLIQRGCVFCVPIFTCVFTCVCFLSPTKQNPKHTPSREARHITVGRVHPLKLTGDVCSGDRAPHTLFMKHIALDGRKRNKMKQRDLSTFDTAFFIVYF